MMVEIIMNPLSVAIPSNGYSHQVVLKSTDWRIPCHCLNCSLYISSEYKQEINSNRIKVERWYTCFGVAQLRTRRMSMTSKTVEASNFHPVASKIGSVEYDSFPEKQTMLTPKGKGQSCESSLKQEGLAPRSLVNQRDLDGLYQPAIVSKGGEHMVENVLLYLEERNEEVLSKRILKLSRLNKVTSVLKLYKSMEFLGLQPNSHACNSLLSCLLRNDMLDDALRIFDLMKAREMTTGHTYSLILKAVANTWGCHAALSMFEELETNNTVNRTFDAVVYNTMISIFSKMDNWVQIENIWRRMQKKEFQGTSVTYRLLVCTFVRCNQNELAFDAYHEMIQNGLMLGEDAMQAIIGACMKEGEWDLALTVFQNMLDRGLMPNMIACNALINSLGKSGKVKLAFKVYHLMKSLGHEPDAYTWNALLGALNKANQHADALQLFDSIRRGQSSILNSQIYITVLMSCQKLGLWGRALQLLWQMEASGLSPSSASYNLAIGACEVARQPKVALQIYDHMVHQKHTPDVFTLLSLIRSCIWGSLWNEVEEILNRYPPNGSLYNAAIQGLCLRRKINLAMKFYVKMNELDLKPDGKTRALVLQNLPRVSRKRS